MTRRTYKDIIYNDFWGGLNLRESANQIQDKQLIKCENFNFEGNRLVTAKKIKKKYNIWGATEVRSVLVDGSDNYFTHWGKLYKNGVELPITTGWPLPDKRWYISVWWDLVFFTFDDGTEPPYYLDWGTLTQITWVGNPRYNIVYNGKLVLWGYDNDNIYFSKTASPTTKLDIVDFSSYSAGNQSVGWDARGTVTWFKVGENWLYVFKKNSVYYTNSENDTWLTFQFIFRKLTSNGAVNQNAIEEVNQEIFYYDDKSKSIRRLGYEQNLTTLRDTSISDEIEPVFLSLADDQSSASLSYKYPNLKIFLRSRFAGEWVNDVCLSYNVSEKSWSTETKKTCSVAKWWLLGSIYEWIIYDDDKNPATEWESIGKELDLWVPVDFKRLWEVEVKWKSVSTMTLYFDIYIDGKLKETREVTVTPVTWTTLGTSVLGDEVLWADSSQSQLVEYRERFDMYYTWRYFQIGIRYQGIGYAELDHMKFEFKPLKWHSIFR